MDVTLKQTVLRPCLSGRPWMSGPERAVLSFVFVALCAAGHEVEVEGDGWVRIKGFPAVAWPLPPRHGYTRHRALAPRDVWGALGALERSPLYGWMRFLASGLSSARQCPASSDRFPAPPLVAVRALLYGLSMAQQGRVGYVAAYAMLGGQARATRCVFNIMHNLVNAPLEVSGDTGWLLVTVCHPDERPGRRQPDVPVASTGPAKRRANRAPAAVDVGGMRVAATEVQYRVRHARVEVDGARPDARYRLVEEAHTAFCMVARCRLFYNLLLMIFCHEQTLGAYQPKLYDEVPGLAPHRAAFNAVFHRRA